MRTRRSGVAVAADGARRANRVQMRKMDQAAEPRDPPESRRSPPPCMGASAARARQDAAMRSGARASRVALRLCRQAIVSASGARP